jgi:two-component sensor histidine kinase
VSELVTNSVRHAGLGPGDRITVRLWIDNDSVRAQVAHPGSGFVPPDRVGGWGLRLVEELARQWGIDGSPTETVVWFEIEPEPAEA